MPDSQQLERTFNLLNRGSGVAWTAKAPKGHALVGNTALSAEQFCTHATQQEGWNFFVCLNPTTHRSIKPSKSDVATLACIGLDVDPRASCAFVPSAAALVLDSALTSLLGYRNNHIVIFSGRGLWSWVFVEPQLLESPSSKDQADLLIKGFTDAVTERCPELHDIGLLDSSCADLSRIARCPGTVNLKNGRQSHILIDYEPIEPLPISMVESLAAPFMSAPSIMPSPVTGESLFDIASHMNLTTRHFVLNGVSSDHESRHRRLFSSAKNLQELGVTRDLAEFCLWSGAERCIPNLNKTDPGIVKRLITQVFSQ